MRKILAIAMALTVLGAPAALAGQAEAFKTANDGMMRDMMMEPANDADHNFAMMMVPHHKGAVEMAKIELQYGHDKTLRAMAKEIVESQQTQIDQLNGWLAAHPAR